MVIVTSTTLEALVSVAANLVPLSNTQMAAAVEATPLMAAAVEATPLFVVCRMQAIDILPEVT